MTEKTSTTEIEIRGALPNRDFFKKIITVLQKKDKITIRKTKHVVIFYKEKNKDFRIKWDKDREYFEFIYKTKKGKQRTIRDEFVISISKKQINEFFKLMEELGLKKGFVSSAYRIDITTPFIVWSIKLDSVIGDYWEAEATDKLFQKLNKDKNKIKTYLKKEACLLGFNFWNEKEFKQIKQKKWSNVQPFENSKIIKFLEKMADFKENGKK